MNAVDYQVAPVGGTASSSHTGSDPAGVSNYEIPTPHWISGGTSPQWITLDLGWPRTLVAVNLCVIQTQSGQTTHVISGGPTPTQMRELVTLSGETVSGQTLAASWPASEGSDIRYLRVQTTESPSIVAWGKIEAWGLASHRPAYFGYYADAFSWLTNVTALVAGHSNTSWVSSDFASLGTLQANLEAARQNGLSVALALPADTFFDATLALDPAYPMRWQAVAAVIEPYLGNIAFIYPIDEPYSQAKVIGTPAPVMKARLETVADAIKGRFPDKPLAFTFSAIDFDTQDSAFADIDDPLPVNFDYFGFDCYGSWDQCGEPSYRSVHPIPWYVARLKDKLRSHQRLFLFSDAFVRQAVPNNPSDDAAQAELRLLRASQYRQLALSDPTIVGLFAFLYQDDYTEESRRFLGVSHWPRLRDAYGSLGSFITGK